MAENATYIEEDDDEPNKATAANNMVLYSNAAVAPATKALSKLQQNATLPGVGARRQNRCATS